MAMGEFGMIGSWYSSLDLLVRVPLLVLHLAIGIGVGVLHFRAIRESARQLVEAGNVRRVAALTVGRLAVTGAVLIIAALEGALPLVAAAAGLMIGRQAVLGKKSETAQ